jgi:hypothetical protein
VRQTEERKKPTKKLVTVLLCIFMIITGLIAGLLISQFFNKDTGDYIENVVDIAQSDESTLEKFSDSIAIPCWDTMTLIANQKEQTVNLYNPSKNEGINFIITLSLEDGTELYKSPRIPSGKAVYDIQLNEQLKAGTYNAIATYQCFTDYDGILNGSSLNFNLIVEEKDEEEN